MCGFSAENAINAVFFALFYVLAPDFPQIQTIQHMIVVINTHIRCVVRFGTICTILKT